MKLFSALIVLLTVLALACFVTEVQASQGAYAAYLVAFIGTAAIAGTMTRSMQMENVSRLYANTLTNLIPDTYRALDVVSRELTGAIPSVTRDAQADQVAQNQTLRIPVTRANTAGKDITPAMSIPAAADQTIDNATLTIQKLRAFPFSWQAEEQYAMNQGPGFLTIQQQQIAQALRAAINEVEADVCNYAYLGASRAYGTAGTTPFASTLGDPAQVRKILDDNGAPPTDRSLVINTAGGAALRTLAQLTKANEAADTSMLRQGTLLDIHGFQIRESAQIKIPTAGTASGATTNNAGYAVGATTLTLASAGTGTILAGDVITFAGDTNKYVVVSGSSDVSAGGTVVLAAPGLRVAMSAATKAITMVATSTRNLAFSRNAILLATRLPMAPTTGDLALMREIVTDPRTGIAFSLTVWPGYYKVNFEIGLAWGVSVIKPEHIATLLG